MKSVLMFTVLLIGGAAHADDVLGDASKLYDVAFEATPKLKKGAEGKFTARVVPRKGAEVHKEAPISLELAGKKVGVAKAKAGRADVRMDGENAVFDVAVTGTETGAGTVDATLDFYICTAKICAKQQRKASVPVVVE